MSWLRRLLVLISGLAMLGIGSVAAVPAASSTSAGLSMTPAIQDLTLSPLTKQAAYSIQLYNHTDQPVTFFLSSRDFGSLNQTGGVAFLGSDSSSVTKGHGLSASLVVSPRTATLQPNSSQIVTATINDVSKLALGGHYAAILAQVNNPPATTATGNHVAINQVLSSLIFLETAGSGTKTLHLLPPPVRRLSFGLPDSVNLVFKATGNTQTVPRGVVSIQHGDNSGLIGQINANSGLILPGSSRLLNTPLTGNRHPWWPGTYTQRVIYHYDGSLGLTEVDKSFFYINPSTTLLMVVLLVGVAYGLVRWRRFWRLAGRRLRSVKVTLPRRSVTTVPTPAPPEPAAVTPISQPLDKAESQPIEVVQAEPPSEVEPVPVPESVDPAAHKIKVINLDENLATDPENDSPLTPNEEAEPKLKTITKILVNSDKNHKITKKTISKDSKK